MQCAHSVSENIELCNGPYFHFAAGVKDVGIGPTRVAGRSPTTFLSHQPKAPLAAGTWNHPESAAHPPLSRHHCRAHYPRRCSDGRTNQRQSTESTPQGGMRTIIAPRKETRI